MLHKPCSRKTSQTEKRERRRETTKQAIAKDDGKQRIQSAEVAETVSKENSDSGKQPKVEQQSILQTNGQRTIDLNFYTLKQLGVFNYLVSQLAARAHVRALGWRTRCKTEIVHTVCSTTGNGNGRKHWPNGTEQNENVTVINPRHMRSEGYSSLSVCLCVCVCLCSGVY